MIPVGRHLVLLILTWFLVPDTSAQGPYAPPAGQVGSDAISADSSVISAWAINAVIERGYMNIADPPAGFASVGDQNSPTGAAGENGIVSLGDGGIATLTFANPIGNIPGPDLAVFENSFSHNFLELAFVEVSSDGMNFIRFEAISLTDTGVQVGAFDSIDATNLHNLAGKYKGGFGTPFDLEELKGTAGLDVDHITHVRIIDVVGSIDPAYRSYDATGRPVNDPWPTAFASSGFDLDAVGVITSTASGIDNAINEFQAFSLYPNPASHLIHLSRNEDVPATLVITDLMGRRVYSMDWAQNVRQIEIVLSGLNMEQGRYLVQYKSSNSFSTRVLLKTGGK